MNIDKSSPMPLYRQVEQFLEKKIISGIWEVGKQLPTEQELSKEFNVSTITVKRGIIELVNKGYLFRQRGKGTFVSKTAKGQDINSLISLTNGSEEKHAHLLLDFDVRTEKEEITKSLGLQPGEKVICIKRLKVEKDEPMALEYTYLSYNKFFSLKSSDIHDDLIYNVLEKDFQILLGRARLYIKPCLLSDEEAKILKVKKENPVFEWERFTYTQDEEVIEYSKFYVRQDKETYYTEVFF